MILPIKSQRDSSTFSASSFSEDYYSGIEIYESFSNSERFFFSSILLILIIV